MWHVGLDNHQWMSVLHILDDNGRKIKAMTVRGSWVELMREMRELAAQAAAVGQKLAVCYEASCGYGHLFEQLSTVAAKVVVAHPGQLRLIFQSKRKHNRIDAAKLATLLLLNQAPPVWVPHQDVRAWRRMIEHRRRTMDKRTMCKNQVRALLRTHGIATPAGKTLWSKKQRPWLRSVELPTDSDALQRDILLDELEHQDRQVTRATRELDRIAQTRPAVALLRTIPGVGPRTAEAVAAYLDDPRRFHRSKCVGAYLGLVPCQDASADKSRLGHITREGPATVRKLLVEAAWQGVRRSPRIGAFYERIVAGKDDRRKIALVATAHWLARVMLAMLRTGEVWRHEPEDAAATPTTPTRVAA